MNGIWIAVMVVGFGALGVGAQLGWELPISRMSAPAKILSELKRGLDRRREQRDGEAGALGDNRGPVVRPGL